MPKIVDQDERKKHVAKATIRIIARSGFESLTMRKVANEAGISYGSVFHYFDTKDAVLLEAARYVINLQIESIQSESKSARTGSPLSKLKGLLLRDAVVDKSTYDGTAVWTAFVVAAVHNESFAQEHEKISSRWIATLEALLQKAIDAGEISNKINVRDEATTLWVLCAGFNQRGLIKPKNLKPGRQVKLINTYLEKLAHV
jgi:AcrR family transcriptional regulator